jgi:hypothetical protein
MQSRLLVDAIVQQTTVLIAQLSTAAGIRAPLAHIADQVFLELSREIERQGVGRKIAADMFGLALRSYQKRVQRLSESATARDRTLWEAIYDFVCEQQSVSRERVEKRFAKDAEDDVAAVINDLVSNGLIYAAGRGKTAIYRAVTAHDRETAGEGDGESLQSLVWMMVYRRRARSLAELRAALNVDEIALHAAVERLVADQRLTRGNGSDEPELHADSLVVPVGAERGWDRTAVPKLWSPGSSAPADSWSIRLTFTGRPVRPRGSPSSQRIAATVRMACSRCRAISCCGRTMRVTCISPPKRATGRSSCFE